MNEQHTVQNPAAVEQPKAAKSPGRLRTMWRLLLKSPTGMIGFIIVVLVVFISCTAELIAPYDATALNLPEMLTPPMFSEGGSAAHIFGTDSLGRDIFSRVLCGARVSLFIGLASVVVAGVIGIVLGLVSGYFGGIADSIIMRVADAFHAVPRVLIAMVVLAVMGPSVPTLIFVIGVTNWVNYARIIRGEVLTIKEKEYVKASRTIGTGELTIILRHVLPNVMSSTIVVSTMSVAGSIIVEAAMSFLGLGIQPPTISWGMMLSDGRNYLATNWWIATFPGLAITVTVLGIMFLGNWLRDVLDPRNQGIQ